MREQTAAEYSFQVERDNKRLRARVERLRVVSRDRFNEIAQLRADLASSQARVRELEAKTACPKCARAIQQTGWC